jgi:hypothetical protein
MKNAITTYLLALACCAGIAHSADTRGYLVERTLPRAGQRGTTVEVIIQGAFVRNPKEVMFFGPGIRAVSLETIPNLQHRVGLAHGWFINEQMRCKFEIAPDCPLGAHPFRVRTATEISSLGTFHVTPFPCVDENEKGQYENDTLEKAMPVTPNVTVRGNLGPAGRGDLDLYRVPAVAGQRLSVEVDAAQISDIHYGDSENDVMVRILDETGKELSRNDDNPLHIQDAVLSVKLPRDGVAYVEVRRPIAVNSNTTYVAHIGNFRRPLVAYPAGGQEGSNQKIRLIGDALGDFEETIKVPETAGNFGYFGDAPSAVPLRSSPFPNVFENAKQGETQTATFPAALNGIISGPEEIDRFRFTAKKGDRLQFRTFAATIGSTIDAKLVLKSAGADGKDGAVAFEADDAKLPDHDIYGTAFRSGGGMREILDPSVVWECKADGDYILEVSDSSGRGGPLGVYRVEVAAPRDALYVYIPSGETENARNSTLAVHQDGTLTATFNIAPAQGNQFKGEFELVAHGLPQGVRLVASRVPAGASNWPVQFVADASAQPGCSAITFEAKPTDGKKIETFTQQNIPFICHPGGDGWRVVRLDRFILAVVDPLPFSISLAQSATPLVRGGEVAIPVKVTRKAGFNGPLSFQADWLPEGVAKGVPIVVAPGQSDAELRLSATADARIGTWPLSVLVQDDTAEETSNNGSGFSLSSEMIGLNVAAPFLELTSKLESIRRGERKKFVWNVKHTGPQPGPAQVRLLGLPTGMKVIEPLPALTQDTQEIAFEVEATDDALLGKTGELNCAVVFQVGNQEFVQRTGKGALRVDPKL